MHKIYQNPIEYKTPLSEKRFIMAFKKLRDIMIGFVAWFIFSNITFQFFVYLWFYTTIKFFDWIAFSITWLGTVVAISLLLFRKKPWICIGLVFALCVNTGISMYFLGFPETSLTLGEILFFAGIPSAHFLIPID